MRIVARAVELKNARIMVFYFPFETIRALTHDPPASLKKPRVRLGPTRGPVTVVSREIPFVWRTPAKR
jgi:hypothetical protein